MAGIRSAVSKVWDQLNPSEPSPIFLARLMAVAITIFAVSYVIGVLVA